MAIWYMNIMKEDENRMKDFDRKYHDYWQDNRRAEVFKSVQGHWGVRYFEDNMWVTDEIYKEHSETYAESAAENYVLGIKNVR